MKFLVLISFLFSGFLSHAFNDNDLQRYLQKHPNGIIYVWSPMMPLSVKGLKEAQAYARKNNKSFLALIDPYASNPRHVPVLNSQALLQLKVMNHYPTIVFHTNGQLLSGTLPGYERPEGLEIYGPLLFKGPSLQDRKKITFFSPPLEINLNPTLLREIQIPVIPSFFFKIAADGSYLSYSTVSPSGSELGNNFLLDTTTKKVIMIPGPWDPVFNVNSDVMTLPVNNGSSPYFTFYTLNELKKNGDAATPFYSDQNIRGYYQSVGILSSTTLNETHYRVLADGRSTHYIRDYSYNPRTETLNPITESVEICSQYNIKLPMMSKDGTELAGIDIDTQTTSVFSINSNGDCRKILDLGFKTGKVNFNHNKKLLTFHTNSGDGFIASPSTYDTLNIFIFDRSTSKTYRLTQNTNANAMYPDFTKDGTVVYAHYPHNTKNVTFKFVNANINSPSTTPPPTPRPTPTASPTPTMPPTAPATFTEISTKILQPKCVGCHSQSVPSHGVRLDSYADVMKEVKAGFPERSALYESILTSALTRMPLNQPPLRTPEISLIQSWIKAGALQN